MVENEILWKEKNCDLAGLLRNVEDIHGANVTLCLNDLDIKSFNIFSTNHYFIRLLRDMFDAAEVRGRPDRDGLYFIPRPFDYPLNEQSHGDNLGLYDEVDRLAIIFANDNDFGLFMSLIYGFCSALLEDSGYHPVHGAVIKARDKGIAFIGGHNSGKTTSLFHFLKLFEKEEFQILTDDWCIASLDDAKNSIIQAFDKRVSLKESFCIKYPYFGLYEIYSSDRIGKEKRAYVNPNDLFGEGTSIDRVRLDYIVMLEPEARRGLIKDISLDSCASMIIGSSYHMPNCIDRKTRLHLDFWRSALEKISVKSFDTRHKGDIFENYGILIKTIFGG